MDFIVDDAFKQTEFYDEYFDKVGKSSTAAVQVSRMFFLILFLYLKINNYAITNIRQKRQK